MANTRLRSGFLFFLLPLLSTAAIAQDSTKILSLDEAVNAALANNSQIRIARADEKIAQAKFKQTDAVFMPQVSFSYAAMTTNNPLNAFGFKLQQQVIKQSDFNPDLLNKPGNTGDFVTKLDVLQPIVNPDHWFMRKGAQKQIELYQLQTQRGEDFIRFETEKAYLQLNLVYESVKVLEEALATTKALYTFTNNRYEQGLLQKSDLLNVQVQVTAMEAHLATAKNNIRNASDYIGFLMGMQTGIIYETTESRKAEGSAMTDSLPLNRADFKAMKAAIEATDLMIQSNKKSYLPRLNAFGTYQLNDKSMLGFGSNAYLAGLQLSWDIFKGMRTKNTIATQVAEKNKLAHQLDDQVAQGQLALNKARRDLADAEFTIRQREAAVAQAEEAFRILNNRYQQGLVNTTDVLMAQTQLSQQKLQLAQASYNRQVTISHIALLTTTSR
ncbi:transporter [Flavihumibacter stibioxidans]|uniref:Transporter n=2 Tax=Flavihumibacter stibioxidans TaxID=1834163 RepID=A0ABR7MC19_9BACT|nr:transporter [Flavihumibacter stibioxidans]